MNLIFKFGDYTTNDLDLHVNPNYIISSPSPKVYKTNVPFTNGSLDYTESMTGFTVYNERTISVILEKLRPKNEWDATYNNFLGKLQGKLVKVIPPYETDYHYLGRIDAGNPTRGNKLSFKVDITCDPYRYKNDLTYVNVSSTTTEKTIILNNEQMPTTVKVATTAQVNIKHGTTSISLSAGTHTLPFALLEGANELKVQGTAELIFEYQEGAL